MSWGLSSRDHVQGFGIRFGDSRMGSGWRDVERVSRTRAFDHDWFWTWGLGFKVKGLGRELACHIDTILRPGLQGFKV